MFSFHKSSLFCILLPFVPLPLHYLPAGLLMQLLNGPRAHLKRRALAGAWMASKS